MLPTARECPELHTQVCPKCDNTLIPVECTCRGEFDPKDSDDRCYTCENEGVTFQCHECEAEYLIKEITGG